MRYLLLGTLISESLRNRFMMAGISPQPADIAQRYILDGFRINGIEDVSMITSPRINGYPVVNIKKIKDEQFTVSGYPVSCVGYLNVDKVNFIFRKRRFIEKCKNWARENNNDSKKKLSIIIYSLNSTFIEAALEVQKIIKNANISVIVADLPLFMSAYDGLLGFAKRQDEKKIIRLLPQIDYFFLYTKQMAEYLRIEKWSVIEGFISSAAINLNRVEPNDEKKVCVYAGALDPIYGIQTLIDSFENIDCAVELHLYGDDKYMDVFRMNKNVKYKGLLAPDEIRHRLSEANLLINPRFSTLELTKYSFPSKTFEYMSSGTPVLMCRLPVIPKEYFDYVYTFEEENVQGFQKKIEEILHKSNKELFMKGHEAATFLLSRTADEQVKKMIETLKAI